MAADLENCLSYCPITGVVSWTINCRAGIEAGSVAGTIAHDGYRRISRLGKTYSAHRVAWLLMTGEWPSEQIDHRNGDRADNRWENLRLATASQNSANTRGRGPLPKGVTFHKNTGKFQAQIKCNGRNFYLGLFESSDDAGSAYVRKANDLFGDFARSE